MNEHQPYPPEGFPFGPHQRPEPPPTSTMTEELMRLFATGEFASAHLSQQNPNALVVVFNAQTWVVTVQPL